MVPNCRTKFSSDCSPPLNLAFIASYLRANVDGIEIKVFDGMVEPNVNQLLMEFNPEVIGITGTTPQIFGSYKLADEWHLHDNVTVVLGGPHVTVLPKEALVHADFVVVGEGEKAFTKLVKEVMQFGKPKQPRIIEGEPMDVLDDLPQAAFDLLNMDFYVNHKYLMPIMDSPLMGLVTSRGCPVKPACAFCYNSWFKGKVRYFSANYVVNTLLLLHEKYGVCNFFFQDDEFLINQNRLKEFALLVRKAGLSSWLKWGCQARVTSINIETLHIAEKSGCVLIVPGMESHNERILTYLKQGNVKLSDLDRAIKLFSNSKIVLMGNFIVGSPSETVEEMMDSIKFFVANPALKSMILNVLTPYPGTKVWADCLASGAVSINMDYSRLVPTREGGFNVSSLPQKEFQRFLVVADRIRWLIHTIRLGNGGVKAFFGLYRAKTWWWMWLAYPDFMLRLLSQNLKSSVNKWRKNK